MQYYRMNPMYKKTSAGQTMTVILDLTNPDPTSWATYADDAVGMTAGSDAWDDFFGHYPCILENGVELGKLKRNNFAQYEDGTEAPITNKDSMICFPRRGIKIEYIGDETPYYQVSVSMTTEENKEGYSYWAHSYSNSDANLSHAACDKFYLGAYKGRTIGASSSVKLCSTSGSAIGTGVSFYNFTTYANRKGMGYEVSGFFQLTFIQVMYLLKYKGQNAQIAVGKGRTSTGGTINTGNTIANGMDYGTSNSGQQMKLFGLEDFYGNLYEFIGGIYSDSNRKIYVADGNFNDSTGYMDAGTTASGSNITGYMKFPNGTNLAGFTPSTNTNKGTQSTYFCDEAQIQGNKKVAKFGGYFSSVNAAGVFYLTVNVSTNSATDDYTGARLMYMHVAS